MSQTRIEQLRTCEQISEVLFASLDPSERLLKEALLLEESPLVVKRIAFYLSIPLVKVSPEIVFDEILPIMTRMTCHLSVPELAKAVLTMENPIFAEDPGKRTLGFQDGESGEQISITTWTTFKLIALKDPVIAEFLTLLDSHEGRKKYFLSFLKEINKLEN